MAAIAIEVLLCMCVSPVLQGVSGDVDALADTMAGLSVKPVQVAQPKGLLKGVAAPAGGWDDMLGRRGGFSAQRDNRRS
jgi:hypothetical protein